jgi:hypothetical protein
LAEKTCAGGTEGLRQSRRERDRHRESTERERERERERILEKAYIVLSNLYFTTGKMYCLSIMMIIHMFLLWDF